MIKIKDVPQISSWRLEAKCQEGEPGQGAEAGGAVEAAAAAARGEEVRGAEAGAGAGAAAECAAEGVPGHQCWLEVTRSAPGPSQCEDGGRGGAGGHVGRPAAGIGHPTDAGHQGRPLQPRSGPGEQRGQPRC